MQAERQQQQGPGDAAQHRDDLARPGDVQRQVEQQAEAEDELEEEKNGLALHGWFRGWNFL